jgi:formylmethanofuran dehydrogenase subunit A
MSGLILKNGYVYDPLNGIKGEKMDICIENGKIVEEVSDAKVIDCSGKVVMPGGVEIHSHLAGGKVNVGRMLRPEDHLKNVYPKTKLTRAANGYSTPSTFLTGYLYAKLGYTTAFTAALPPLMARHTHEELHDIPMLDKGALTLMGNNWFIMRYLKRGDVELAAAFVAWLLKAVKGYAIKVVNPGGGEAWGWGRDVRSLDDPVPHFDITPREIISGLVKVNEMLALPHSIHLHANNLGRVGNFSTTLETMQVPNGTKPTRERQVLQLTHAQFHSYGGDSWKNFASEAESIAKAVNSNENVIIDIGQVVFGDTTTMTADGPMEYYLSSLTGLKWANKNIELETSPGVTPFVYSKRSPVSAVQWAVGLELALHINDAWKVLLTTDHPNGAPFFKYPTIIAWLMSSKYREETMKEVHSAAQKNTTLATIDREYDFYEIATITRAGQAKSLGIQETKGHLGVGADADVAVYDINPEEIDPSRDYKLIEEKFARTSYTIKGGEIVVKDGEIVKVVQGKTLYIDARVDESLEREVMRDIDYYFKRFYSVNLANYPVQEVYLTNPTPVQIDATNVR